MDLYIKCECGTFVKVSIETIVNAYTWESGLDVFCPTCKKWIGVK